MQQLQRVNPKKEATAGKRLPYAHHLDEVTLETRDGLLMQVIHLAGLPFETADSEELNYRKAVRDVMLRGLASSRFAVYHHVVRRQVDAQTQGAFPDAFSADLDATWSERLASRKLYVNDLFLTIVRRPLQGHGGVIDGFLRALKGTGKAEAAAVQAADRRELDSATGSLISALAPYGARVLGVYDGAAGRCSEPLEFLSCLYNGEMRPVLVPVGDAGEYLPYRRASFGHETLELSRAGALPRGFGSMVSIKDYPAQTTPGMLDDLLRLPCEMVITQSFGFVDRQPTLERMNLALRRMKAADDDGLSLRADLTRAKDDVVSGRAAFGEHHLTVLVRHETLEGLDRSTAEVLSAFTEMGAIAVREDINLEPAFWAQFPGNFKDIARKAMISTANFAGFASGHNFPVGQADNNHWGPAVTLLETTSAGPYHFNFHKGDLGNFTVIGPSGSGKTVVLNFLLAQARKYAPRIVFFDKDRGAEIFLRAIGGRYETLRPGTPTGFNPLALADNATNRRFLTDWVAKLIAVPGEVLSADDAARIKDAVDANFDQAPALRRLRFFAELFRGSRRPNAADLAARLAPWHGDRRARLAVRQRDRRPGSRPTDPGLRHDPAAGRSDPAHPGHDVPVPPRGAAPGRPPDPDRHRRGLEGAGRRRLRGPHPRLGKDPAQAQRRGRLRHPERPGRPGKPHRQRHHRAGRDPDLHGQSEGSGEGLLRRLRPDPARVRAGQEPARHRPLLPDQARD
jgi:type IV secretion system protein VirB4